MPTLYIINGIHVIMRTKGENGPHHTPHVHIRYSGETETIDFEGNTIAGRISQKQHQLISDWAAANKVYLKEQWDKAMAGEKTVPYKEWKEEHKW